MIQNTTAGIGNLQTSYQYPSGLLGCAGLRCKSISAATLAEKVLAVLRLQERKCPYRNP